jgi:excisionase family DNA binding protein
MTGPWFGPAEPLQTEWQRPFVLKHAAQKLGISEKLMQSAVAKGQVRSIRLGGRILIPGSEVKRLYEGLK